MRSKLPFCKPPSSEVICFFQYHLTCQAVVKRMLFCIWKLPGNLKMIKSQCFRQRWLCKTFRDFRNLVDRQHYWSTFFVFFRRIFGFAVHLQLFKLNFLQANFFCLFCDSEVEIRTKRNAWESFEMLNDACSYILCTDVNLSVQ